MAQLTPALTGSCNRSIRYAVEKALASSARGGQSRCHLCALPHPQVPRWPLLPLPRACSAHLAGSLTTEGQAGNPVLSGGLECLVHSLTSFQASPVLPQPQ